MKAWKTVWIAPAAAGLLLTAGCNVSPVIGTPEGAPRPIAEGAVVSLTVYDMPTDVGGAGGMESTNLAETDPGCRVEVYDAVIVVRKPDGRRLVLPHGWYSDLEIASRE